MVRSCFNAKLNSSRCMLPFPMGIGRAILHRPQSIRCIQDSKNPQTPCSLTRQAGFLSPQYINPRKRLHPQPIAIEPLRRSFSPVCARLSEILPLRAGAFRRFRPSPRKPATRLFLPMRNRVCRPYMTNYFHNAKRIGCNPLYNIVLYKKRNGFIFYPIIS